MIFNDKFAKIWIFSEILLFVLIGAEVDIKYMTAIGLLGIILGIIISSIGVFISLVHSNLNKKEKMFTILTYTLKATVQATIWWVSLSNGLESGMAILSIAVLAIIIAPMGCDPN